MMNNILKNKNLMIKIGIALLAIIIILILVLGRSNFKTKSSNNDINLEESLIQYGKKFYKEKYYPGIEDKTKLSDFTESGINVSLANIDVTLPLDEKVKTALEKDKCSLENSMIIFNPISPYEINDYKIKVELACEK